MSSVSLNTRGGVGDAMDGVMDGGHVIRRPEGDQCHNSTTPRDRDRLGSIEGNTQETTGIHGTWGCFSDGAAMLRCCYPFCPANMVSTHSQHQLCSDHKPGLVCCVNCS